MVNTMMDNLGIPPLAGICSYETADKPGYQVDFTVQLLKRYNYVKAHLVDIAAAHLPATPEWEVKCALSHHMWLDAEHSLALRKRVSEMREPPLGLDRVPDEQLKVWLDEAIRANDTTELLTGIYAVIRPALLQSMKLYAQEANPLADHPTWRLLRQILREEEEMLDWGFQALQAFTSQASEHAVQSDVWAAHLSAYLQHAGGMHGNELVHHVELPQPRNDGKPYEMAAAPRRDDRFQDHYNNSALIDEYYQDEALLADERVFALYYKRLREMDVPEWMAPILFKTKGQPWEYYSDLSRQLWDEARHAMLGEVGLYSCGVPFYRYPVDLKSSMSLNVDLEPIESHVLLWAIEQGLMNKETGKRWEWLISKQSGMPLAATVQDYDWADEVLHAQIGRRWLVPKFGSMEVMQKEAKLAWKKWDEAKAKYAGLSKQEEWWPQFVQEMRSGYDSAGA
ncbi:hypothetical protein K0T92_11575 [Paenibacillus oenotherae]|uniref:Uncharacterized protein n=1 Tax=Paenibacillus oenotherae TaxID=1435645 RepID=A0ABS7D666_9BACL|nr:hypothetical protein [Paenibacillus oenotherae]MBW7475390.1 hypothetical protein [Paenibacillus oenotherae]